MDKRIYDVIQFIETCEDEKAKRHIRKLLKVCKEYVRKINSQHNEIERLQKKLQLPTEEEMFESMG